MKNPETYMRLTGTGIALAATLLVSMASTQPALAEQPATTLQTLLDKQQIQDMLVDYYAHLGKGSSDFGAYYLPDGTIDVNGLKGAGGRRPLRRSTRRSPRVLQNARACFECC